MALPKRTLTLLSLLAVLPFAASCGDTAAPPAEEPPQEEAAPEPTPEPEPVPEEEAPAEPQVVGNIIVSGADYAYDEENVTNETAPYFWEAEVRNDTTATLDITVSFDLVDANGDLVKRERKTMRLQPASRGNIREGGSMSWDEANRVEGFVTDYSYQVVTE